MRKPFLTGYKRHNPPGFKTLNFSIFLFTLHYQYLSVPKHPISIKNVIHCGALQSRRAISGLFSFFLYTLYIVSKSICVSFMHASLRVNTLTLGFTPRTLTQLPYDVTPLALAIQWCHSESIIRSSPSWIYNYSLWWPYSTTSILFMTVLLN